MPHFKDYVRDFFTYTRTEKRGVILLLFILVLSLIALYCVKFTVPQTSYDFSQFKAEVDSFYASQERDSVAMQKDRIKMADNNESKPYQPALFLFDPNHLPDSLWIKLGLSERQLSSIRKYEAKGGRFFSKEDVKKMYVITPEMYNRIEPYIRIEKTKNVTTVSDTGKKEIFKRNYPENKQEYRSKLFPLDINNASIADLEMLPGIGPSKAKAIFNYKILLGGYISIEQLKEAYGINDSLFDIIKEKVFVNPESKPVQININAEKKESLRHPYISFKLAEIILSTRKARGNYSTVDDLRNIPLMKEDVFRKLGPYLKVE